MTVGEKVAAIVAEIGAGAGLRLAKRGDTFAVVCATPEAREALGKVAEMAQAAGLKVERRSKRTLEIT